MGKKVIDAILDAMLTPAEGTHIAICSAEPADFAGIAALTLAGAAITGSYAKAAGDVSGRKNTLAAQSDIPISADGTANHVVTHNNTDTMCVVTTCTPQALTSGGYVNASPWAQEIRAAA